MAKQPTETSEVKRILMSIEGVEKVSYSQAKGFTVIVNSPVKFSDVAIILRFVLDTSDLAGTYSVNHVKTDCFNTSRRFFNVSLWRARSMDKLFAAQAALNENLKSLKIAAWQGDVMATLPLLREIEALTHEIARLDKLVNSERERLAS